MRGLTTNELDAFLKQNASTKRFYLGTYPSCVKPISNKNFYFFISNTDNHKQSGEHWNAWVVKNGMLMFFDSFGRDPRHWSFPEHYADILNDFTKVKFSKVQVQHISSVMCGYFCIHFLYLISLGLGFEEFYSEYSANLFENDNIVNSIVHSLF